MFKPLLESSILSDLRRDSLPGQGNNVEEKNFFHLNFSFSDFRLSYYPHLLAKFNKIIAKVFGGNAKHKILGDFEPLGAIDNPSYYIHICQKP